MAGSICLSAQKKVGINTEDPKFTLDVNGTVRLGDAPEDSNDPKLLGVDKNTHQIVKLPSIKKLEVFEKLDLYVPVTIRKAQENGTTFFSYIHTFENLNIDPETHFATLLSATLVTGKDENESPVAMKIVSVADKNTKIGLVTPKEDWTNRITNVKGWKHTSGTIDRVGGEENHIIQGSITKTSGAVTDDKLKTPFLYETPLIELVKHNANNSKPTWHFRAEYDFSSPLIKPGQNLFWKLHLLIIKKTWVKEINSKLKLFVLPTSVNPNVIPQDNTKYPVVS